MLTLFVLGGTTHYGCQHVQKKIAVKNEITDSIETSFPFYAIQNGKAKISHIEYKIGDEPHVDVYMNLNTVFVLDSISKDYALKLVSYFIQFCGNTPLEITEKQAEEFLVNEKYAMELHYEVKNKETVSITCLFWSSDRYVFFYLN